MRRLAKRLAFGCAVLSTLAACGNRELLLPGERLDPRSGLDEAVALAVDQAINQSVPHNPGPALANANWTHLNGSPSHAVQHPALSASLTPIWSQPIGQGNSRKHRITADPVVANGRVFTLDSRARVTAHATSGQPLWSRDLTPSADGSDDASGGGLAVAGSTLYVTTAFGELTALDTDSGQTRWVQDFDAAVTGAPTAVDGVVYVVTRNQIGWAIDASNGRILWQVLGARSESGIAGGPAPAVAGELVVFPFGSAQMVAAVRGEGTQAWTATVAGLRPGRAFSRVSDLTGDPVVTGDTVYAGNHAGRAAAFNRSTGQVIWSAEEGAIGPIWLSGEALFLVSDENRLIRLDADTGETIWAADLPFFTRERLRRRKSTFSHYGPVLAGGRLLVPGDDGALRQFSATDGSLIGSVPLPSGAATNPVVAGGVLYLVTEDGQLRAWR